MNHIGLNKVILKALLGLMPPAADDYKARYRFILLEKYHDYLIHMATDGVVMAVVWEWVGGDDKWHVAIPADVLTGPSSAAPGQAINAAEKVVLHSPNDGGRLLEFYGLRVFRPLQGAWGDSSRVAKQWRDMIPTYPSGEDARINPYHLARAQETLARAEGWAGREIADYQVNVMKNGCGPWRVDPVSSNPAPVNGSVAVVMPMRDRLPTVSVDRITPPGMAPLQFASRRDLQGKSG